ncbi:hypothetical protein, partial [Endozoicomonas lisbonensis]
MSNLIIPNQPPEETSQDFFALRDEAVATLQQLAGDTWTDHNLHDPGITLLEALCFVMTDLGYRLDFPVEDLVAKASGEEPDAFPQPRDMLPCQPVTESDYRRLILDIPGVRNALVAQSAPGLWAIQVIPDANLDQSGSYALAEQVREVFLTCRNLGEDLDQLSVTDTYDTVLQMHLDLEDSADPVETLAQIYSELANLIAPQVRFHDLDTLERAGHHRETLQTGPWLNRGYLPDSELERPALVERVFVSDLMTRVLNHPGVRELNALQIATIDTETSPPDVGNFESWVYTPEESEGEKEAPVLNIEHTLDYLTASKNGIPINIPRDRLMARYHALRFQQDSPGREPPWQNPGRYRHPGEYLSLQQELPSMYGVGTLGLAPGESAQRVSEVRQLQGFLLLFDQVLGNQFAQMEQARVLLGQPGQDWLEPLGELLENMLNSASLSEAQFSLFWQTLELIPHSHVAQPVDTIDPLTGRGRQLQELPALLGEHQNDYQSPPLQALTEAPFSREQLQRLIRAGNHLLARSHEQLPDAAQLRYEEIFRHYAPDLLRNRHALPGLDADELTQRMALLKEAVDRALFLRDVVIGSERARGIHYTHRSIWGSGNLSGLKQRLYRRLGLATLASTVLSTSNTEGFHLVEDTLLRHGISDNTNPLSVNTVYLVVPVWPSRLADDDFRQLFRQTIEQELPVHLHPHWLWLDRKAMADFEKVYNAWRNAMTRLPGAYSPEPDEEKQYRTELAQTLSASLRTFILSDGSADISQWS